MSQNADTRHLRMLRECAEDIATQNGPIRPPLMGAVVGELAIIITERPGISDNVLNKVLAMIEALRDEITA